MSVILDSRGREMSEERQKPRKFDLDPNPISNQWSAYDSGIMYLKAWWFRPKQTAIVTFGIAGCGLFLLGLGFGLAGGFNRSQRVSWDQIDPTDVRQVGYYLGQSGVAPIAKGAGSVVYASFANNQQQTPQFIKFNDNRSDRKTIPVFDRNR